MIRLASFQIQEAPLVSNLMTATKMHNAPKGRKRERQIAFAIPVTKAMEGENAGGLKLVVTFLIIVLLVRRNADTTVRQRVIAVVVNR